MSWGGEPMRRLGKPKGEVAALLRDYLRRHAA